ncbi:hypothetical protein M3D15_08680 [Pseudoclavibacter alba]|uniref:Phage tail protein n=1 Tax=Pseudoclavibacter albus TaxID=272241 RepID=A0ABT2HYK5_9MICO|nr:hypothetical protein [Pseudoclavibacter alba]MCT2043398.1 hypothetical protein [Pseudoclavibacter alba]
MPVTAQKLGPGSLKLGAQSTAKEFAVQTTKCTLKSKTDADDDLYVLSGDVLPGAETISWELDATILQDYELDGLTDWLFTNRGSVQDFTFVPNSKAKRSWTGKVKIRPLDIGGDVNKNNTSDVTFPLVGEPKPVTVTGAA